MNTDNAPVMSVAKCIANLENYELPPDEGFAVRSTLFSDAPPNKPWGAAVVGEGVLSFVTGMQEQNKLDIQHSYLFASLVANKAYPSDADGEAWYRLFLDVMQDCGWIVLNKSYQSLSASGQSFKMDQLVLKVLSSVVAAAAVPGPTSALMLKVAGDALATLQSRDEPLQLFERNVKEVGSGGFGLASCNESDDGEVIMALGAVRFSSSSHQVNVLFTNWDSSATSLYRGECYMTMAPAIIAQTRDIILSRLGSRAVDKISQWEI